MSDHANHVGKLRTAQSSAISEDSERKAKNPPAEAEPHPWAWQEMLRITFVAMAAAGAWFLGPNLNLALVLAGVACALVGGYPIFHEAIENILERRMTMELSMAIAILAALAIREVFTALVITLFVLVAEVLEGLTVGRGRQAIRHLIDLLPSQATVNDGGAWKEVGVQEVSIGTVVLIKPGSRIPVDGSVVGGHSFVDQATITGESMPAEKNPGAEVYAGTINQSGDWKFARSAWAATPPSEKSFALSRKPSNRARPFSASPTASQDTWCISPWALPC